jgi:hypothetical protein
LSSASFTVVDSPVGAESMGSMMGYINDVNENNYERKRRINKENAAISKALSDIINKFVMTSELTSNKQRFTRRRHSGSIVEGVFALEWLFSELELLSSNGIPTPATRKKSTIGERLNQAVSVVNQERAEQSLIRALTVLMNQRLRHDTDKRKATIIVEGIWDEGFLAGEAQQAMINQVQMYISKYAFAPANDIAEDFSQASRVSCGPREKLNCMLTTFALSR